MDNNITKSDLALELAKYSTKNMVKIYRAAKHIRKFDKLTKERGTALEELEQTVKELEEDI